MQLTAFFTTAPYLPLRRRSTPSARRRSATWRLRRGSPCEDVRQEGDRFVHHLCVKGSGLAHGNEFLPLGLRETAGHFVDEDVRREEVMDRLPEIVAQPNGLGRQRAADHPTYRGRRVEDVLHGSSSSSSSPWNVWSSMRPCVR